ncbi:MAG: hypothetical protein R3E52_15875 [Burkholderiaceae bacterium]
MSAPAHDQNEPIDPIEAATHKIPWAIPLFGAVMIFLLAMIAVTMA